MDGQAPEAGARRLGISLIFLASAHRPLARDPVWPSARAPGTDPVSGTDLAREIDRASETGLVAEIAPDYIHPETGQTLQAIARQFDLTQVGMRRREDIVLGSFQFSG